MSAVLAFCGILILMVSIFCMLYNPQYTIIGCVCLLGIDFCFKYYMEQSSYQTVFKLLILISALLLLLKSRKGIHKGVFIICFALLSISVVLLKKYHLPDFNLSDVITSFMTTMTGFLLMCVAWGDKIRVTALKVFSYASIFSTVMGILVNQEIFATGNKLHGLDTSATLVMISAVGMLACYILVTVYQETAFFGVGIVNFVICGLTNMRGGLLFAIVLIFGMSIPYIKRIPKRFVYRFLLMLPVVLVFFRFVGKRILEKTMDFSYSAENVSRMINTSNRAFAWKEMLKATEAHRILGWGIGYTKKIDGIWLNYGYRAIHNEYIRWLVETGYIGLFGIIICFFLIYIFLKKHNIGLTKSVITFLFIGFAIFSYTDNTMNGTTLWMAFSLIISLIGENVDKNGNTVPANNRQIRINNGLK